MSTSITFGSILTAHRGIGPGFDFARIALAIGVVLNHSFVLLLGGEYLRQNWWGDLFQCIVPAFFALSGFLVAGSLFRLNNLKTFFFFRFLRIFPALFTEIILSALILGPLLTAFALNDYFSDPRFSAYFFNLVGYMHYILPGVFVSNKVQLVNGSLYTVPSEILSYITLAVISVCGVLRNRKLFLICFSVATLLYPLILFLVKGSVHNSSFDLVPFFYAGVLLYLFKDRIPMSIGLFGICLAIFYAGIYFSPISTKLLGPVSIAYCICYIGMQRLPHIPFLMSGDLSYGIYLFGYPIQQTLLQIPGIKWPWFLFFFCSVVVVSLFAHMSWICVEKPALALRKWTIFSARTSVSRSMGSA